MKTALTRISLVGALVLVPASAAQPRPKQVVQGSVIASLVAPGDVNNCWTGVHQVTSEPTNGSNQGVLAYDFEVDKGTWKKRFVLKVDEAVGGADLDIVFFENLVADPNGQFGNVAEFESRAPGGEKGRVPKGFRVAVVCLYSGTPGHQAANASFTYTAG